MTPEALIDAAVEYADRGFTVIPLGEGKRPATKALLARYGSAKWGPLRTSPPSKADLAFLCSHPATHGVGLVCGVPDQPRRQTALAVVDFDQEIPAGLDLPDTPIVKTSRGCHVYFHLDCPRMS